MSRELKVGALALAALAILAVGVFLVGEKRNIFSRKNTYFVRFKNVSGLSPGSPVELNGVNVGSVDRVVLPERVDEALLTVWLSMDRRYAPRVRADSLAKIKTLGLLGDKYIEITSGSPASPEVPSGGEIPAAPATDVDKLMASGEDLMENVTAISVSLRKVLADMEAGRGLLGELISDQEAGRRAKQSVVELLESINAIAAKIDRGEGSLGRLLNEDGLAVDLEASIGRLDALLAKMETGDGALPALINDPALRARVEETFSGLEGAAKNLSELTDELSRGDGLLASLLHDQEFADEVRRDLRQLLANLNSLSQKLDQGEGTVGQLINDPHIYQALNDVVVGINDSRLMRWLIRNRQRAGFKARHRAEMEQTADDKPAGGG